MGQNLRVWGQNSGFCHAPVAKIIGNNIGTEKLQMIANQNWKLSTLMLETDQKQIDLDNWSATLGLRKGLCPVHTIQSHSKPKLA